MYCNITEYTSHSLCQTPSVFVCDDWHWSSNGFLCRGRSNGIQYPDKTFVLSQVSKGSNRLYCSISENLNRASWIQIHCYTLFVSSWFIPLGKPCYLLNKGARSCKFNKVTSLQKLFCHLLLLWHLYLENLATQEKTLPSETSPFKFRQSKEQTVALLVPTGQTAFAGDLTFG